jgi:hypothetical protein
LTVTNPANGCTASDTVNVTQDAALPNVDAGPDKTLTCTVTSVQLQGSSSTPGATFSWSGPSGFSSTSATPTVTAPGLYTLTVTNPANGCTASDTVNVGQNITAPNVDAGADKTLTCTTTSVTLNGLSSTPGATFSWSGPGGFSSTSATPTATAPGLYTLTVTNPANGCTASDTAVVAQNTTTPSCLIAPPSQQPLCGMTGNGLTATAGGVNYAWSVSGAGWSITNGQGTNSITYTAGAGTATFTLTVTAANGCTTTCTREVSCTTPQLEFCTLTQGAYGNRNGRFNGERRDVLIGRLLNDGLTLGIPGERSIIFNNDFGTVGCIIEAMPAGGTASALPSGFNASVPAAPPADPCSPLTLVTGGRGRFRNVLIGQVLALSLNLRLDTHGLGDLTLCRTFVTKRALPGPDGLHGTNDDLIDPTDLGQEFSIPSSVLSALSGLGLPQTVEGLRLLANRALAGQYTGGVSIPDINTAVSAINEGFDECRFLISCNGAVVNLNVPNGLWPNSLDQGFEERGRPADFATFVNSFDSFGWATNTSYPLGQETGVAAGFEAEPAYSFRDWLLPSLRSQWRR